MRTVAGVAVLCLGLGALGWWGSNHNAVSIEQEISGDVQSAAANSEHPLITSVAGRDITVTGLASSTEDRDAILAAMNAVDGRRIVVDNIRVLDRASPYVFTSVTDANGQTYSGNVPSEAQREAFSDRIGAAAAGLSLASGMPDTDWPGVVGQGLDALSLLKNGELNVNGRDVTISGLAAFPRNRDTALAALAGLPEGYTLSHEIALEDDGTPMRLTIRKDDTGAVAVGKLPSTMEIDDLQANIDTPLDTSNLAIANIAGANEDWPNFAAVGVSAMADLNSGTLAINDQELSLTGSAVRTGKESAEAKLASLANTYVVTSEIDLEDDGRPFALSVSTRDDADAPTGKLPFGMDPSLVGSILGAEVNKGAIEIAQIESAGDIWPEATIQALSALAELETGDLEIKGQQIMLRGVATRAGRSAATVVLQGISSDFDQTLDISLLDDGAPFMLNVIRSDDGQVAKGKLPFGADPSVVETASGQPADTDGVTVAEIDDAQGGWSDGAAAGLVALRGLEAGTLSIIDRTIALNGTATRAGKAAALDALANVPDEFEVSSNITIFDDGVPLGVRVTKDSTMAVASGKMPFDMQSSVIENTLGVPVNFDDLRQAEIEDVSGMSTGVMAGLNALNELQTGTLDVAAGTLDLTGVATRTGRDAALAALADLGDGFAVTADISIADDGQPFVLNVQKDANATDANGKLPFGMSADVPALVLEQPVDVSNLTLAETESERGFAQTARTGLAGLAALESGTLSVTENAIRLSGVARTPADGDRVAAILADATNDVTTQLDLTYIDDGSVPAWTLSYVAGEAANLTGKLPAGLSVTDPAELAGLQNATTDAVVGLTGNAAPALGAFTDIAPWVDQLESFVITGEGDDISIIATALPEVPVEGLRTAMSAAISVPVTLNASADAIAIGAVRTRDDGQREEFTADGWVLLPEAVVEAEVTDPFVFAPSVETCDERSRAVLTGSQINFVTGGAEVDPSSAPVLSDLSRIMLNCLQDDTLAVQIGGHTDSVGSEDSNQALSEARAISVLTYLADLGVESDRVSARGFGENQPIADNETEEGRATNRRTEFTWSQATADQN